MATLKASDLRKMTLDERKKKLDELRIEIVRARVDASKTGNSKVRQIKRLIARILTVNNMGRKK